MKKIPYAFVVLIAVSLLRGIAGPGINASSGVFLTPVAESLGVGIGRLSLYLSISSVVTLLFLPIAGNLYQKYSVRKVAVCGIVLQSLSFLTLGYMHSVFAWYLLAIPLALGSVLLVNLLGPLLVNRWFASNIGLMMGIMMMITSLSGAIIQPLLAGLVTHTGWRNSYISFASVALVLMVFLAVVFVKDRPEDKGLTPYGQTSQESMAKNETKSQIEDTGVTVKLALRSIAFVVLLFFMIVLTGFAAFQQHIATFGLGLGITMQTIGTALSISMIGSAIGSVFIGVCSDRVGVVKTSIGVLLVGMAAVILFYSGKGNVMLFFVATFLHGLATSAIGVVAPLLTIAFFGNAAYEKLFSAVMIGSPLASIVLMPVYGFCYDRFGNYTIVFVFLLCALVAATFLLPFGFKNSKKLAA